MIEFFTNVQNLLSLGVGVLVFATLVTLLGSFSSGAKLEGRLKAVAVRLPFVLLRFRPTGPI